MKDDANKGTVQKSSVPQETDGRGRSKRRVPTVIGENAANPENKGAISGTLHTEDPKVVKDCILKLCAGLPCATVGLEDVDIALKTLFEMEPQSPMERMLMTQMIQVSNAAAQCMNGGFSPNCSFQERKEYLSLATKFHRTFVAQIEALQKLRGKGGQHVRVEHVHVHSGGQAIVGNVEHTSGGGGGNGS
jgi:hypothetical protein